MGVFYAKRYANIGKDQFHYQADILQGKHGFPDCQMVDLIHVDLFTFSKQIRHGKLNLPLQKLSFSFK
jgi:hypothetical protein